MARRMVQKIFPNRLAAAVSVALLAACPIPAFAQFGSAVELADINGSNAFVINGAATEDLFGDSVSAAGDVNGDGIDDLIVGAKGADPNGKWSGSAYVVFGSASGFPHPFEVSSLDGVNGFVINGAAAGDLAGISVSGAGDVNGDGIDDLIVGAYKADPNGSYSGASYVIFGATSGLPNPFNLSSINGVNGFVINGTAAGDKSGHSVSGAGDVNGDGIDDVIIGAHRADAHGRDSGASYVVFGSASGLPNPFNLSSLNGVNGFVMVGGEEFDYSGFSVSGAGDVNGDGIDDVIIGAYGADPNGSKSGASYVVFGSRFGMPDPLNLSSLNGLKGFVINGAAENDHLGHAVSAAGDVNGDGIDDVIIGAWGADPNGSSSGASYVVFGSTSALPSPLNVSSLNGVNGFVINGETASHKLGYSVSAAGDVNGDGIDDLMVGAMGATFSSRYGSGFVVFGSASSLPSPFNISSLDGVNGFAINGAAAGDTVGDSLSAAGDVNGDGVDDLIIGALGSHPNGNASGASYVLFGRKSVIFADGFDGPL